MLICNPIQTKRHRIWEHLQKISERDLYASDINFHSANADVWAKKPHKCLWIRECWSAHTELSELQCLWVSWEAESHKQLGKQRSKPREREQEQRCCSAQLQWGTDYTHLRAGRVWNGNEEKISLPLPSSYSKPCSETTGKQAAHSMDFVSFHCYSPCLRESFNCCSKNPI